MNKKILVIEDENDLRELLRLALTGEGYQVETLSTANQVREGIIPSADLYLVDVNLPGVNGLEVCKFIKTNDKLKSTPVILISANPELAVLADLVMADGAIAKPLNKEILVTQVYNLLNKKAPSI